MLLGKLMACAVVQTFFSFVLAATLDDELRVDTDMTSFVQDLLSPGDDLLNNTSMLDLLESSKPHLPTTHSQKSDSGALILQMLQNPEKQHYQHSTEYDRLSGILCIR